MAGRKNHHIPQLLQRGFGSRQKKSVQVWVFDKHKDPFPTSTANFGAQRDFYIDDGDTAVDDQITVFEEEVQGFIQALRSGSAIASTDNSKISKILAHLELRSKFIRDELLFLTTALLEELMTFLKTRDGMRRFMQNSVRDNPTLIQDRLSDAGLNEEQQVLANGWLAANLDHLLNEQAAEFMSQFLPALQTIAEDLATVVKSSHLKALRESSFGEARLETYLGMSYRVIRFSAPDLILPDTMVAFLKREGAIAPFLDNKSLLHEVYIPLSSQSLIYGYHSTPQERSLETINRILASCSAKNFVAQEDHGRFRKLTPRIGKHAKIIDRSAIRKIIRDTVLS